MRLRVYLIVSVFLFFVSCSKENVQQPGTPGPDLSGITKLMNDSVASRFGGNAYVAIKVGDKLIYEKSYGGYDGNTVQFIASCSKWLSVALVMTQVDEGKLSLADTVGKFLPVFSARGKGGMTIRQLLSHTSGFPGQSARGYEREFGLSLAESVDSIALRVPLVNVPGTFFDYGEVSMQVAGRIAELVSGKNWNALFNEKIGQPCGMASTSYGLGINPIIGGGAKSSPNDYLKFLSMILNKGSILGKRVLSEAAVDAMERSQIGTADLSFSPYPPALLSTRGIYGLGLWRDLTGAGDQLIEASSPGLFGTHPWINRDQKLTAIVFTFIAGNGFVSTLPTCVSIRMLIRSLIK
jgi:CubicO group peptidase (beta-lactamase class C family)